MEFLYLLEKIRVPILNEFMLLITTLGEETAFLIVAMIVFWCVDKRKGYFVLSVGFIGTIANQFMKLYFQIPRPWIIDKNFTILEQAREAASGYSFPSGHTQSAVGTFGGIAYTIRNKWIRIIAVVIAVLVPFSRMYIGVHTPLDVITAAALAVLLIIVVHPFVFGKDGKYMSTLLGAMLALAVSYLCYVEFYPFSADMDAHNYASAIQNAYTLFGALIGLLVAYIVDEKWLHFPVNAVWWAQIIKVAVGFLLVVIVKSGLKAPLNMLFGEHFGRSMRYFLMVIVAGVIWPLSFRWFGRLKNINHKNSEGSL